MQVTDVTGESPDFSPGRGSNILRCQGRVRLPLGHSVGHILSRPSTLRWGGDGVVEAVAYASTWRCRLHPKGLGEMLGASIGFVLRWRRTVDSFAKMGRSGPLRRVADAPNDRSEKSSREARFLTAGPVRVRIPPEAYATVAQLVEQSPCKRLVVGSSPTRSLAFCPVEAEAEVKG